MLQGHSSHVKPCQRQANRTGSQRLRVAFSHGRQVCSLPQRARQLLLPQQGPVLRGKRVLNGLFACTGGAPTLGGGEADHKAVQCSYSAGQQGTG